MGWLVHDQILNFCTFCLSIYHFSIFFTTTGIERTAMSVEMEFGISTWIECGMVLHTYF